MTRNYRKAYGIAFQRDTGELWTARVLAPPNEPTSEGWNLPVMLGTSPSIAGLPEGGEEVAFQHTMGHLWTDGFDGKKDQGYGMMAGTSPSITRLSGKRHYGVAFQDNTGMLCTIDSDGPLFKNWNLSMRPGTSPSIAVLSSDAMLGTGYAVAFQDNTGMLCILTSDGTPTNWNIPMMGGTSPSIAGFASGGYVVAFQDNTGKLRTRTSNGTDLTWNIPTMPGTSPSITAMDNGYAIASQAKTGELCIGMWTAEAGGTESTWNLPVMTGTSPSIAGLWGGGYVVALQDNTGKLRTLESDNTELTWDLPVMTGTSPSITETDLIG